MNFRMSYDFFRLVSLLEFYGRFLNLTFEYNLACVAGVTISSFGECNN